MSAMHQAARTNDLEGLQQLLVSGKYDINERDGMKRTPLAIAAWAGHVDAVKLLLRNKAKPNVVANDNFMALHFASNVDVIKELVKKDKQSVKARVSKGNKTALHLAIPKGNIEVITCLLDAGSDITAKTGSGQSCLELAKSDEVYALLKTRYQERLDRLQEINRQAASRGMGGDGDGGDGAVGRSEDDEMDAVDGDDAVDGAQRGDGAQAAATASSRSSSSTGASSALCPPSAHAHADINADADVPTDTTSAGVGLQQPPGAVSTAAMPQSVLGARTATEAGMQQQHQKQRKLRMKAAAAGSTVKLSHLDGDDEED